jgi:hypothetical protein
VKKKLNSKLIQTLEKAITKYKSNISLWITDQISSTLARAVTDNLSAILEEPEKSMESPQKIYSMGMSGHETFDS